MSTVTPVGSAAARAALHTMAEIRICDVSEIPGVKLGSAAAQGPVFPCLQPVNPELKHSIDATASWMQAHEDMLSQILLDGGALLFRGFPLSDSTAFERFLSMYPSFEGGYAGGTSPRGKITARVMESTNAPSDRYIANHQEMAYATALLFPSKIAFYAELAPVMDGETPVCNMRRLTANLPQELCRNVREKGLLNRRHFRHPSCSTGAAELDSVHKTWCDAFSTESQEEATRIAESLGSQVEWVDTGIVVSNFCPGFTVHPDTGEMVWFNSVGSFDFSVDSLGEKWGRLYARHYGDKMPFPYFSTYGDGSPISAAHVAAIHRETSNLTVKIPWKNGDVLLLDNILTGHGRSTFTGPRKIRVMIFQSVAALLAARSRSPI